MGSTLTIRRAARRALGLAAVGAVLLAWSGPGATAVGAQQVQAVLSDNPKESADAAVPLTGKQRALRPNITQNYYLYVENPTANGATVTVDLVRGSGNNAADLESIAEAKDVTVKAGTRQKITFASKQKQPAASPPAAGSAAAPPGDELTGPFNLQVRLTQKNQPPTLKRFRNLLAPHEFITAKGSYDASRSKKLLTIELEATDEFFGPPATVRLFLPPYRIPGLKAHAKTKSEGTLDRPGAKATLWAQDFLERTPSEPGFVYVDVDGYERAFVFRTTFSGASFDRIETQSIRVLAPVFAQPTANYPVHIEVDNWPGDPLAVRWSLTSANAESRDEQPVLDLPTDRDQRIFLDTAGPDGALVFTTHVHDWQRKVDVRAFRDAFRPSAELYDGRRTVATCRTVLSETNVAPAETVVFDDTPPDPVRLSKLDPDVPAVRGQALKVVAIGVDPESGIDRIRFYVGPPEEDGKPPAGAKPLRRVVIAPNAKPNAAGEVEAQVDLLIPKTQEGPVELIAEFENRVGLKNYASLTVPVTDPPAPAAAAAAAKTGTITGTVLWGGRIPQPNLNVILYDTMGKEKKAAKTDKNGVYTFKDVEPGEYHVASSKEENGGFARDQQPATAEAGKTTHVDLNLMRKP